MYLNLSDLLIFVSLCLLGCCPVGTGSSNDQLTTKLCTNDIIIKELHPNFSYLSTVHTLPPFSGSSFYHFLRSKTSYCCLARSSGDPSGLMKTLLERSELRRCFVLVKICCTIVELLWEVGRARLSCEESACLNRTKALFE